MTPSPQPFENRLLRFSESRVGEPSSEWRTGPGWSDEGLVELGGVELQPAATNGSETGNGPKLAGGGAEPLGVPSDPGPVPAMDRDRDDWNAEPPPVPTSIRKPKTRRKSRAGRSPSGDESREWGTGLWPSWPPRQVGDYEILGEIARGGMGIVCKARHRRLGRIVALKMIVAGEFAARSQIQRFQAEAGAVARLDHPHIVTLHEYGVQDGVPFFTMKFVEGISLAERLKQGPYDQPEEIARLVAAIARAVHHAHQRGVLHRDLKPANILLDHEGRPYVTDFGLAKRIDEDQASSSLSSTEIGHPETSDSQVPPTDCDMETIPNLRGGSRTHTGAVLGTPGFMAFEQASGRIGDVTILTDVHGLGAILYAVLTGQPPNPGSTTTEILNNIEKGRIIPPSKLRGGVHRDLERICLKCLSRNPEDRYPSALAVAEDLERVERGEPISLESSYVGRQVWNWLRRRLRTAVWVVGLGVLIGLSSLALFAKGFVSPSLTTSTSTLTSTAIPLTPLWWPSAPPPSRIDPIRLFGVALGFVTLFGGGLLLAWTTRPRDFGETTAVGTGAGLIAALVAFVLIIGPTTLARELDTAMARPHPSSLVEGGPKWFDPALGEAIGRGLSLGLAVALITYVPIVLVGTVVAVRLLASQPSKLNLLIPYAFQVAWMGALFLIPLDMMFDPKESTVAVLPACLTLLLAVAAIRRCWDWRGHLVVGSLVLVFESGLRWLVNANERWLSSNEVELIGLMFLPLAVLAAQHSWAIRRYILLTATAWVAASLWKPPTTPGPLTDLGMALLVVILGLLWFREWRDPQGDADADGQPPVHRDAVHHQVPPVSIKADHRSGSTG